MAQGSSDGRRCVAAAPFDLLEARTVPSAEARRCPPRGPHMGSVSNPPGLARQVSSKLFAPPSRRGRGPAQGGMASLRPGGGVGLGQLAREAAEHVRFGAGSGRRNFFWASYPGRQVAIWRPKERKGGPAGSVGLTLGPGRVRIPPQNRADFAGSARPPKRFRLSWLRVMDTLGPSSFRRQARGCVRAFCCAQVKLACHSAPFLTAPMWGPPGRHREATAEGHIRAR